MFSPAERAYLESIATGDTDRLRVLGRAVTPGYRRKLQWSIRQKATRALSDWELYLSAVERDPRVASVEAGGASPSVPVYTDPFIVAARAVASAIRRLRREPGRSRER